MPRVAVVLLGLMFSSWAAGATAAEPLKGHVHDLSLLVAPEMPCVWPVGMMQHSVVPNRTFGASPYHRDLVTIDEHTGTQWDAPAHFVPPPDSGLPGAGPMGLITGDKVPAWQFIGEACVIDIREHIDNAPPGSSFLITPAIVQQWEKKHRPVGPGDVVLFRSDYSDRYFKPLATGGERFVHTVLRKDTSGWPAPTPECMKYLGNKKVMALGLDGASMGPVPDLAVATHQAGGQFGMIWTECATNLGSLPTTGACYVLLAAKHVGGSGGEARAIGITEPTLAKRLIDSAKAKRVVDLSVSLDEDLPVTWPGSVPGDEASRYIAKTLNAFGKARGPYFARAHLLDSQAGTHLVPPSFSLPPQGFNVKLFTPEIQRQRMQFEAKYGELGHSDLTTEKVPLEPLIGDARVIDVRSLIGSTKSADWPASPRITVDLIKAHEQKTAPIRAGEIVIFRSGYTDAHFQTLPALPDIDRLMASPLAGKTEAWPAATADVIVYLAEKGVRCIGTDGPTLGGVHRNDALATTWATATRGVFVVEFLTNVGELPEHGATFLFAPIKIKGTHGGYGRALAVK
ncbi:MAG: cyclase family protein [Planctomycetales bacterium]|nr:cyclase family protein [Planctomycetales bacterium]